MTKEIQNIHKKVTTSVGTFTKFENQIGLVKYNGRTDVTLDELKDFLVKIYDLMDHKPFYLINDLIDNYGGFSNEIWKFLSSDPKFNTCIIRSIVISNNLGMRIQLNFFVKILKPKFKVTMVKSIEKAFELAKELQNNENSNQILML